MEEIWKPVVGWEGRYEVSNLGNVRNCRTGKLRSFNLTPEGYEWLTLTRYEDHKRTQKWYTVHSLVANAFLPNPSGLPEIDHKDGNRVNNKVDNLEWVTRSENQRRARSGGSKGPRQPVAQYTEDGKLVAVYRSMYEAYKVTGIAKATIYKVVIGMRHRKTAGGYVWKKLEEEEYERLSNKD